MPYVKSSAIRWIEYDPQSQSLHITFVESGGPYTYYGVPANVYKAFLNAPSKGGFYNDHIKDRYS